MLDRIIKAVLHDVDDAESQLLLRNPVEAMIPWSSLLIDDCVLRDVGAPVVGDAYLLVILIFFSGIERSESQRKICLSSIDAEVQKV